MTKEHTDAVILEDSPEAAKYVTVGGWVDRHGRFFGVDERTARWSGATHIKCANCGKATSKTYTICCDCRLKRSAEKYAAMEPKEWDFDTPLYSEQLGKYFFDDEVLNYVDDNPTESIESLMLVICEPVYLRQIDSDYFYDDLPDDGELPEEIVIALANFNNIISQQSPVSWAPGKYRAVLKV